MHTFINILSTLKDFAKWQAVKYSARSRVVEVSVARSKGRLGSAAGGRSVAGTFA